MADKITFKVPEGCEIDMEKSSLENGIIEFKKKEEKYNPEPPKSWTDYRHSNVNVNMWRYNSWDKYCDDRYQCSTWLAPCNNTFKTKEELKAYTSLGKLIQLRDAWWGDWKPRLGDYTYDIYHLSDEVVRGMSYYNEHLLMFPTESMCNEFYACFKDLIEEAKMFI